MVIKSKEKKKSDLKEVKEKAPKVLKDKYFEAVGRRKTAVARVRLYPGKTEYIVNEKKFSDYFPLIQLQKIVEDPIKRLKIQEEKIGISAKVAGGGIHAQAEAIRHGVSRALLDIDSEFRKRLKKAGFLTRDPRMKERKKYGLKGARKAPQWAKR
ncbi:MAG: 30S ribosomal protein S9 [Parcubacteria group bacterium]|nr:30S ribosomal protein S9 [Parcubacteria group bacterium]